MRLERPYFIRIATVEAQISSAWRDYGASLPLGTRKRKQAFQRATTALRRMNRALGRAKRVRDGILSF